MHSRLITIDGSKDFQNPNFTSNWVQFSKYHGLLGLVCKSL